MGSGTMTHWPSPDSHTAGSSQAAPLPFCAAVSVQTRRHSSLQALQEPAQSTSSTVGDADGSADGEATGDLEGSVVSGLLEGIPVGCEVEGIEVSGLVEGIVVSGLVEGKPVGSAVASASSETASGDTDGLVEGSTVAVASGDAEGLVEGSTAVVASGDAEGLVEGSTEGSAVSASSETVSGDTEGLVEGSTVTVAASDDSGLDDGLEEGSTEGIDDIGKLLGLDEGPVVGFTGHKQWATSAYPPMFTTFVYPHDSISVFASPARFPLAQYKAIGKSISSPVAASTTASVHSDTSFLSIFMAQSTCPASHSESERTSTIKYVGSAIMSQAHVSVPQS